MNRPTYVVELPDGKFLGRLNLSDPLMAVPRPFAYTYNDRDAAARAAMSVRVPAAKIVELAPTPKGW